MEKNKIKLSEATFKDEKFLLDIRNKNREFFFNSKVITKYSHNKWFVNELNNSNDIIFVIKKHYARIGTISIVDRDYDTNTAELGRFIISKKYRHMGYGKIVLNLFFNKCEELSINKLYLYTLKNNINAINFYLHHGFLVSEAFNDRIMLKITL